MAKNKTLGDDLLDLEAVLDRIIEKHDIQWGDLLNLVHGHLQVHRPDAQEEYVDGTHPIFYYGPKKE